MSTPTSPRILPYGDRALLLDLDDAAHVLAWAEALRSDPLSDVAELVPGGATLLVVAHDPRGVPGLRATLEAFEPTATTDRDDAEGEDDDVAEIPVVYDGPDLDDVAELTGLDRAEVIAAHTGQTWRVAFAGFAPGFGYLVGEDERLRVPRRESSRTAVPAGAVGLAEEYGGVYPRESPGGWQLIGHTDVAMWDLDRDPPALLVPGARVRFLESE